MIHMKCQNIFFEKNKKNKTKKTTTKTIFYNVLNTYHAMGRFSRRQIDDIIVRKPDLTLYANSMKCQILFSRENEEKCCLLNFLHSMQRAHSTADSRYLDLTYLE